MKIEPGSKLVMIGDSITDAERARPVGEGLNQALGKGYVSYVDALLGSTYPHYRIRVVNMGVSGDTVRHLQTRWERDVLNHHPEWISVMIGTNDVWRQFDLPLQTENHISPEEYEERLEDLIRQSFNVAKGMVLMSPFYIEPNQADPMRERMDEYGRIVRDLARKFGTLFVDTQAVFDSALQIYYPAALSWDRVHPNHIGHMLIARSFLWAIGYTWK